MSYRSVVCVYYPHQLLPALVAVMHHRRYCLNEPVEQPTLIHVRILIDNDQGRHIADAIQQIVGKISWLSVEVSYPWKLAFIHEYYLPVKLRAHFIRQRYKQYSIREIFYAHDLSADFLTQTFTHAFPKATRICFGDALGIVYSQDYFTKLMYSERNLLTQSIYRRTLHNVKSWLKLKRRQFVLPKNALKASFAILILPCDPGNDVLTNTPFQVPSKSDLQSILDLLTSGLDCNDSVTEKLIDNTSKPIIFLALSNLTDSKLARFESELMLYQEIVDKHVPKDSLLIIKLHPGTHQTTLMSLKSKLTHACEIHYIDLEYSVYPIELHKKLLLKADKILSISYTSISLPYLYGREVCHVLDNALIETYFESHAQNWVKKGNQEYLQMIEELMSWDGKIPLLASHKC